jgi:peptidyl-dipeptidase Dcp
MSTHCANQLISRASGAKSFPNMIKAPAVLTVSFAVAFSAGACATTQPAQKESSTVTKVSAKEVPAERFDTPATNPLLREWAGPYGGVPAFDEVRSVHFKPAIEQAMIATRREIDAIANNPEPASFENTSVAFENSGRAYTRVQTFYNVWESTLSSPEFQAIEREMAPKVAAFADEIVQNSKLFARIEAVYQTQDKSAWSPEQKRLAWHQYNTLVLAGAKLDEAQKPRQAEINQRLATLYTNFSQNVLSDEETYAVILESEADLDGLPESLRAGAAAAAAERGKPGKWAITNTRSSVEPWFGL